MALAVMLLLCALWMTIADLMIIGLSLMGPMRVPAFLFDTFMIVVMVLAAIALL